MENDAESILTRLQQRLCRDSPSAEHIVSMENRFIVQVNIGKRIQAIKHQIDMIVSEGGRVGLKCSLIFPVSQADPLQAEFVIAIERVRDEIIAQQVGMHYSRDLCRMP